MRTVPSVDGECSLNEQKRTTRRVEDSYGSAGTRDKMAAKSESVSENEQRASRAGGTR